MFGQRAGVWSRFILIIHVFGWRRAGVEWLPIANIRSIFGMRPLPKIDQTQWLVSATSFFSSGTSTKLLPYHATTISLIVSASGPLPIASSLRPPYSLLHPAPSSQELARACISPVPCYMVISPQDEDMAIFFWLYNQTRDKSALFYFGSSTKQKMERLCSIFQTHNIVIPL
jgi:hypothetical protein